MEGLERLLDLGKLIAYLLMGGLHLMSAVSIWQAVATHKAGDEPLSRSWTDAAKSFVGMTVTAWLLVWGGAVGYEHLLRLVDDVRGA